MQGGLIEVNDSYCRMSGYSQQELLSMNISDLEVNKSTEDITGRIQQIKEQGTQHFESRHIRKDGTFFDIEVNVQYRSTHGGQCVAFIHDITERNRAAEEKNRLESSLHQAQKMESVGRLAGGVAHDFNNMLTIIMINAQLALMKIDHSHPLHNHLEEILHAADRSAEITKQLLAFSRQQAIEPRILDLNDTVSGMLKMLRRLIGEDIDVIWKPGIELLKVKIDPSQLDQIMANLCVNARDAISGIGRIAIQTENVICGDNEWDSQFDISPGRYVVLAVSDNGSGIPKDVITHIFEPFYTTKEAGKGTGLGLATVFGIVQQNGGQIKVYSEPEKGTTFRVYLPGIEGATNDTRREKPAPVGGNETILLVEDEKVVLHLGAAMLTQLGYTVLSANSPEQARQLADENPGRIRLLVTDIIMPGMNGCDLSHVLLPHNPGMKCLFMSGYTADVMFERGSVDSTMHFLQKPFNMDSLSIKIRETLDNGPEAG